MEVIKDQYAAIKDKIAKELVTPEKCSFCGEDKDFWFYCTLVPFKHGGLSCINSEMKYVRGRFFHKGKFYTKGFYVYIDKWKCYTCGSEWKGNPYRVDGY